MDSFSQSFDFIMERARSTAAVMQKLTGPPHNWNWTGVSANNFQNMIEQVDTQVEAVADAEAATLAAGANWDEALDKLLADASLGSRLARVQFKTDRVKTRLLQGLRTNGTGRDVKYKQLLDFESSWERADAAWTFRPGLTLALFKTARQAIKDKEDTYMAAYKSEQHARALLHSLAEQVNDVCVDWYEVSTATFGTDSVAGQLVRTIPTTYNPETVPAKLLFTTQTSSAPGQVQLAWTAARAEYYDIYAQAPGSSLWDRILDGVAQTSWTGQGMIGGTWKFKGQAHNAQGSGPESDEIEVTIALAQAA